MLNKKIILLFLLLLPVAFLLYCFYPVFTYDTRLSQHVNHPPSESLAPGRILLTDRKGKVITDKAYPNGYYRYYNTAECFTQDTGSPYLLRKLSPSTKGIDSVALLSSFEEGGVRRTEGAVLVGNLTPGLTSCEFLNALLHIEDKNFYSHWGVNLPAKVRAFVDNIQGKRISGGSTITEQYVKNKYFKNSERGYLQKAREAVLALWIDMMQSKTHILHMYLQDVYLGNQLYGLGAALEVYFGKQRLGELTQEEITLFISLIHNPGVQSLDETYFQNYFSQVQQRLGYTFEQTYTGKLSKKENIDLFPHATQKWIQNNAALLSSFEEGGVQRTEGAVLEGTRSMLPNNKGVELEGTRSMLPSNEGAVLEGDAPAIKLSIDAELQTFAQEVIQEEIKHLASKNVSNAAVFALSPKTNEILLYIGSKDFHARDIDGQVDVIQALRQPGSTMKPFLYLQALESGMNPDDLVLDIESEYNGFQEGSVYISENYTLKEYGLVRLKKALGNSFNNASVRLARELGLQKVYEYYERFGFVFPETAEYYGYSLVLGNASITLESLVRAYVELLPHSQLPLLASQVIPLYEGDNETVTKVSLMEGDVAGATEGVAIEGNSSISGKTEGVATLGDEVSKFLLYDILSDPDNRDVSFGVNSVLNTSIPQAVKTGTSSDFRDNLVVSYHPDFVIGVWVGNNDNSSMQGVTGISGAGYIWKQIIEKSISLGYITEQNIEIPKGVIQIPYCLDRNCLRQENTFAREGKKYESRLAENIYHEADIAEILSDYERERLEQLGVRIE